MNPSKSVGNVIEGGTGFGTLARLGLAAVIIKTLAVAATVKKVFMSLSIGAKIAVTAAIIVLFGGSDCDFKRPGLKNSMTREEQLLDQVKTLMRIMLVSERTPPEHRHVVKFNPLDFHTLGLVRSRPGVKASAVANALGIAATTASSVIARLKSQGLIERRRCCFDRRAYELHLTRDGSQLADTIHDKDMHNMSLFLSALTDGQQLKMLELLDKVVDKVEAIETRSG